MSPFLASARTFNTLAFLLAKLYYKNLLSSSKASDVLYREKTAYREKKKKNKGAEGHCTKRETSVIFPEREGFSFGTS